MTPLFRLQTCPSFHDSDQLENERTKWTAQKSDIRLQLPVRPHHIHECKVLHYGLIQKIKMQTG